MRGKSGRCSADESETEGRALGRCRRRLGFVAIALVGIEAAALRVRTGRVGGRIIVRCRQGHLFSTIWIPGASLKSVRLGLWRFQRCPVGNHWSLVEPVNPAELSEEELASAREHQDTRIP